MFSLNVYYFDLENFDLKNLDHLNNEFQLIIPIVTVVTMLLFYNCYSYYFT